MTGTSSVTQHKTHGPHPRGLGRGRGHVPSSQGQGQALGVRLRSWRGPTPHQPRACGPVPGPPASTQESTQRHRRVVAKVTGDARAAPVSDLHE